MGLRTWIHQKTEINLKKIKVSLPPPSERAIKKQNKKVLQDAHQWLASTNQHLQHIQVTPKALEDISFAQNSRIPQLAWCSVVSSEKTEITFGSGVYKHTHGIIEGVWDGSFDELNYADSKYVYGSGITIKKNAIILTPPSHMYECIFCIFEKKSNTLVFSNSLSFALSKTTVKHLLETVETIRVNNDQTTSKGIFAYDPHLFEDKNIIVYGLYYHNATISENGLQLSLRIDDQHSFLSPQSYEHHLLLTIDSLIKNGSASLRHTLLSPISTVSRG